jgi:hypothetical protein
MAKTEEIDAYICDACGNLYDNDSDADDCCPNTSSSVTAYKCCGCDELHENESDAKQCCK